MVYPQWLSYHNIAKQQPYNKHAEPVDGPTNHVSRRTPDLQEEVSKENHRHSSCKKIQTLKSYLDMKLSQVWVQKSFIQELGKKKKKRVTHKAQAHKCK